VVCWQFATVVAAPSASAARPGTAAQVTLSAASLEAMVNSSNWPPETEPGAVMLLMVGVRATISAPSARASSKV